MGLLLTFDEKHPKTHRVTILFPGVYLYENINIPTKHIKNVY